MNPALQALTKRLAKLATHYDITGEWPARSLDHLTDAGAWTWVIPRRFGGLELDPVSQTNAYEAIAAGCMSTLLILTQRDAACELIAHGENEALKQALLPKFAAHEILASVGISQLTTSHQTGRPTLSAKPEGDGFMLNGFAPWVTGAEKCEYIVTGGVLPDRGQVLAAVPTDTPGVTVDRPMQLMALQSSATSEVHFKEVLVEQRHLIRGPAEKVLSSRSTVKPLVVATAGVGLAGTMVRTITNYAAKSDGILAGMSEEVGQRYEAMRDRLMRAVESLSDPEADTSKTEIRVAVNDLLMRLAIAMLTFSKGSGFLRQLDAQRLVREAMFFLVWSAPEEVRTETLSAFLEQPQPRSKSMSFQ